MTLALEIALGIWIAVAVPMLAARFSRWLDERRAVREDHKAWKQQEKMAFQSGFRYDPEKFSSYGEQVDQWLTPENKERAQWIKKRDETSYLIFRFKNPQLTLGQQEEAFWRRHRVRSSP
jgi:hypothetical protein